MHSLALTTERGLMRIALALITNDSLRKVLFMLVEAINLE
jgi:hypothetical protein